MSVSSWSSSVVREHTPARIQKRQERASNAQGGGALNAAQTAPAVDSVAAVSLRPPNDAGSDLGDDSAYDDDDDEDEDEEEPLSDEEDRSASQVLIGGEGMLAVDYPPREAAPLPYNVIAPPPRITPEEAPAPAVLAIPFLPPIQVPQMQWPPFLPPPPWMPAPPDPAKAGLPPLPPPQNPGRLGRPKFRELQPPVGGWLEVARAPAASTTLNLSPGSGAKGSPTDATLLNASKGACGSLRQLDLTSCPAISPEVVINVCRANPRIKSVRNAYGTPWAAGAVTQLLEAAPELKLFECDLACRKLREDMLALLNEPVIRPRCLTCINKIEPATAIEKLAPALKTTQLRRLILTNTAIGPESCDAICQALSPETRPGAMASPTLPPLKYLSLRGCRLGRDGAVSVSLLLRNNPVLRGLDMSFNRLGDEGCLELAHALCRSRGGNDSLRTMLMARNGITEISAVAIAEMIDTNQYLEVLNIADNDMGPTGGRMIAQSLQRNFALQELYAYSNSFGEAVGKAFLAVLQKGKCSLWKLDLPNNDISEETTRKLAVITLAVMLRRQPAFDWERAESFEDDPYDDESDSGSDGSEDEGDDEQ